MTPWVLLIFVCFFSTFNYNSKLFKILLFVLLFVFLAFRAEDCGTDTKQYLHHIAQYNPYDFSGPDFLDSHTYEITYNSLIRLLYTLDANPYWVLVFFAFVTLFFLAKSSVAFNVNPTIALFFFLIFGHFVSAFNGSRQMTSCAIALYGVSYLLNNNPKRFVFWILVSSTIHFSTVIWLILAPLMRLYEIKLFRNRIFLFILISLSLPFIFIHVDMYQIISFLHLSDFSYGDSAFNTGDQGFAFSIKGILAQLIMFLYITFILFEKICKIEVDRFDFIFVISVLMINLFSSAPTVISRIFYLLKLIYMMYFALFFSNMKPVQLSNKTILYYTFCIVRIYITISFISQGHNGAYPYKSVLFS